MSLVECKEIKEGRRCQLNEDQSRTYTRVWRSVTNNDADGPLVATTTDAFPTVGFPYATETESDPWARVKTIDVQQDSQDARIWLITLNYDTRFRPFGSGSGGAPGQSGAQGPQNRPPNPLNAPVKWSSGTVRAVKAATKDKDGKAYINSAGAPFSPPPELYKPLLRIIAQKNYGSFPVSQQILYWDKVNVDPWMGFPADTVKVDDLQISEEFANDTPYLAITWTFLYDPEKWIPFQVLDKGWYEFYVPLAKPVPIIDSNGNLIEGLLDGTGHKTTTPAYIPFRNHDRVSFAGIP